jgi:3-deoxy-D-manno-octulosonic-acid transferase
LAPLLLRERAARGKEDWTRLNERLGLSGLPRPDGRLVWIHGASVGESLSALPLIAKLLEAGDTNVLATSGTVTSAAMMSHRLPAGAIHQFVPLDTPGAVARFLDHWKPDAGLFVESDLWPNLILAARARGVALALVNARISARSAQGWNRARKSVAALLSSFTMVLAQDEEIAARFQKLGAPKVEVVGSLKADAPPLGVDEEALVALRQAIGKRPVLLAAQTHPGEDETVLPAHDLLRADFPDLLTILVPRHTGRGADLEMLCGPRAHARRSTGKDITGQTAIYIADTMGELGLFYRLAPFCFLGGTLVPMGGHNVLEPAQLRCAVLAGPHTQNAPGAFDAVLQAQGFGRIASSAELAREAGRLLRDPAAAREAGDAAAHGAAGLSGAVARTMQALKGLFDAPA